MTRQRKWQIRHVAAGLCKLCSEPRSTATYCMIHTIAHNRQVATRDRARMARGLCVDCDRPSTTRLCPRHTLLKREYNRERYEAMDDIAE